MRNEKLDRLDGLVGHWHMTMSDAWFIEPPGTVQHGSATVEWFGDAFVVMRTDFGDGSGYVLAIGRSDANDDYVVLYHDERGVCRRFDMAFDGDSWTLERADPDFHQRFLAKVHPDRIEGRWEASEDAGTSWRKDFDLTFVR